MSKGHAYSPTRCWHTPAVSKCLRDMPTCRSHTPAMGKCLRDVPKAGRIYLWGANVRDVPTHRSHTPAVGKFLRDCLHAGLIHLQSANGLGTRHGPTRLSKRHADMLVAYTCSGQMSKGHPYMLVAYTSLQPFTGMNRDLTGICIDRDIYLQVLTVTCNPCSPWTPDYKDCLL